VLALFALLASAAADSVKYSYDDAGRLILVDYGAGKSIAYTYDKAGNLLSSVTTAPASASASASPSKREKPRKVKARK